MTGAPNTVWQQENIMIKFLRVRQKTTEQDNRNHNKSSQKRIKQILQRSAVSDDVFLHMLHIDPSTVSSTTASPAIEYLNQININESSFKIVSYKNNPNLQANEATAST